MHCAPEIDLQAASPFSWKKTTRARKKDSTGPTQAIGSVKFLRQRILGTGKHVQQSDNQCANKRKQGYQSEICGSMFHEITLLTG